MQVAPGGIVVKTASGDLKSYNFKDAQGNDIVYVQDGKEIPLRSVKKGDKLSGTLVTTLPPTQTKQRSAVARATAADEPAPAQVAAAAPAPCRRPRARCHFWDCSPWCPEASRSRSGRCARSASRVTGVASSPT